MKRLRLRSAFARFIARAAKPGGRPEPSAESVEPVEAGASAVGYLDAFRGGWLSGWAWTPSAPHEPVEVQVSLGGRIVDRRRADLYRADLLAAGIGSGRHAFNIPVDPRLVEEAQASGLTLDVSTCGPQSSRLGSLDFSETAVAFSASSRSRIETLLGQIVPSEGEADAPARAPLPGRPSFLSLVSVPPVASVQHLLKLSPYCEHIRARFEVSDRFPVDQAEAERDHFYRWYLDTYVAGRASLRAPLSASDLVYLNATITLGGRRHPVSRALLWYAVDNDEALGALKDLDDDLGFRRLAYWWACEKTAALNVEDCLVTHYQTAFLQAVGGEWRGEALPLSRFVEEHLARHPDLAGPGHLWSPATRAGIYFALIVSALDAPGLLRFLPSEVIERFLLADEPLFDRIAARMIAVDAAGTRPDHRSLIRAFAARGFDVRTMRFRSITPDRHRIEANRLQPLPRRANPRVQVLAPFGRASGLATAGRSSRDALMRAGLESSFVEFGLDNPQPHTDGEGVGQGWPSDADINILHVNADLLPLAFAYLPDVFSRSYVVGFFFWEMDRVAEAQLLGLNLVDEIWVSSEYNRRCFERATDKPVINMGLSLPDEADPDRAQARRAVAERFGFGDDLFTICATYDSFSYPQRKNPLGLIRAFRDAFADAPDARLIVKTHNATVDPDLARAQIFRSLLEASQGDPRILFLDQTLNPHDLRTLIAGVDCYASLHRSEGFGLGMLEAMRLGTPVVCTAYGGNLDFCGPETSWLVTCDEVMVRSREYAFAEPGHLWGEPRHASAVAALQGVRAQHDERARRSRLARSVATTRYGVEAAAERYRQRIETIEGLVRDRLGQTSSSRGILPRA